MADELSHFDETGASRMVDVSDKPITLRTARATARVEMDPKTLGMIKDRRVAKGDVFEVARLAGIMAAKRTGDLIPLCHPLALSSVAVDFELLGAASLRVTATVKVHGRTGVEMEALAAVTIAGLTIYDMCKAVDRSIVIRDICLEQKSGGVHGDWRRDAPDASSRAVPPIAAPPESRDS